MNFSVYLPDTLKSRLDAYVKEKGISTNSVIRKAVESFLNKEKDQKWGDWINQLEPDIDFPDLNELRMGMKPPAEDIF
jgi:predicted transcriptional regulator